MNMFLGMGGKTKQPVHTSVHAALLLLSHGPTIYKSNELPGEDPGTTQGGEGWF